MTSRASETLSMKPSPGELSDEQIATLRRLRGRADAKELARTLDLSRKQVEEALAGLDDLLPVWRAREPRIAWMGAVLLLLLAGWFAYANNLDCGFHFDDNHAIELNTSIRVLRERSDAAARGDDSALDRARNWVRALTPAGEAIFRFNHYRMVTYWTFALNYTVGGLREPPRPEDPFVNRPTPGWHITNNAIHVLNGLLVLWVAYLTLTAPVFRRSRRAVPYPLAVSLLAALVFLLHPMQTQAVTYLTQRTEALCATFFLLSLGCYAAARSRALELGARAEEGGEPEARAPWLTPLALGGAFLVVALLAVAAGKTELVGARGFLLGSLAVAIAAGAGVVTLVRRGYDERRHAWLSAGSFLAFLVALETKEVAATIPFVICAWELLFVPRARRGGSPGQPWLLRVLRGSDRARLRYLGPWAGIVGAVLLLTLVFGGGVVAQLMARSVTRGGTSETLSASEYALTQLNVLHTYVRGFALPTRLHLDHDYPQPGAFVTLLSGLGLLGALVLALARAQRARVAAFALLAGLLILAPTSSIIALPDVIYEHRFYLPLAGAALVLALLAERLIRRFLAEPQRARALIGLALVAALGLSLATRARNRVWADEVSLWQDVTAKSPGKPRAWTNLGLAYQAREPQRIRLPDGRILWGEARELPGGVSMILPTAVLTARPELAPSDRLEIGPGPGGPEPTRRAYEEALRLDPGYRKALNNLALVWVHARARREQEITVLETQLIPRYAQAGRQDLVEACRTRVAACQVEIETAYRGAENAWTALVEQERDFVVCVNLGNLKLTAGDYDGAITWIRRGIEKSSPAEAHAILGDALYLRADQVFREGLRELAEQLWREAVDAYGQYLQRVRSGGYVDHVRRRQAKCEAFLQGSELPDLNKPPPRPQALPRGS